MEGRGLLVGGKGGKRSGRGTTRRSLVEMYSVVSRVGLQQMHGAAARGIDASATPEGALGMPGHF